MIKKINLNSGDFRDQVISLLEEDYELGLDTSQSSFIYKIIDSLSQGQTDVFESINNLIDNNTFETFTGTSLDSFFEIFNLERLQFSNGDHSLEFTYIGTDVFHIVEGTKVNYLGETYETVFANTFQNYTGISGIKMIIKKTGESAEITSGIELNDVLIDMDGITHSYSDNELFLNAITNKLTITNSEEYTEDIETDTSFLNRSKRLLQNFSSNSIDKIETALREISTVNSVTTFEDGLTSKIIVIPSSIDVVDNAFEAAQEIVNYFKNKTILLQRPNYTEFNFYGILRQVDAIYHNQISTFIRNYITSISFETTFNRNDFEFKLIEFLRTLLTNTSYNNFDRRKIVVNYKTFAKCNKNNLIYDGNIYENQNKSFDNNVFATQIIE